MEARVGSAAQSIFTSDRLKLRVLNVPIELRIKYDRVADAIYIRLRDEKVVESDEVAPGVIVDLNEKNEIVGIEVLWVSKRKLDLMKLIVEGPEALVSTA